MADARNIAESYSVGEVAAALGLSRTTLLYYESKGIVRPKQDATTGYRRYTNDDILRLMNSILLKNVGVAPRDVTDILDGDAFCGERFDEYDALVGQRIERLEAVRASLASLREMLQRGNEVRDEWVEPHLICFDTSSSGFRGYPDDTGLDALLASMPIGSLGMTFAGDYFNLGARGRWGRTVPQRYAHLVEGLPEGLAIIGGCRCLTAVKHDRGIFDARTNENTAAWRLRAHMREHGLRPAGNAFCPYVLPTERDGIHIMVCLPVEG